MQRTRSPQTGIVFRMLLILRLAFSAEPATAQQRIGAEQLLTRAMNQCMHAQTAMQCREALPACRNVLVAYESQSATPDSVAAQDKVANQSAKCTEMLGQYSEAEQQYRQSVRIRLRMRGNEHVDVATSLSNLATAIERQGRYVEAAALHQQALAMRRKLLGNEHADVAASLSKVGTVLNSQGKYEEAEMLFRQAAKMQEKLVGIEHLDVASSLNYLSIALVNQARYAEAEAVCNQALRMRRKLLGPEHPDVARSINNLARVLESQGKFNEAEAQFRRAIEMYQKLLGAEHPEVARSLNNLAFVLSGQGKNNEAETMFRQALQMRQKLLGLEHPHVASSLNNLALSLSRQGKHQEAATLYRQALEMRSRLLGAEHPELAESLNGLAAVWLRHGQLVEATAPLQQAAHIRESQIRRTVSETRVHALLKSLRSEEDVIYGLLLTDSNNSFLRPLALTTTLLRKGRVAEAGANANRLLHRSLSDPVLRGRFSQWLEVRQRYEALLYNGAEASDPTDYRAHLKALQIDAESIESQLSAEIPEIKKLQPPGFDAILPAIVKRLPSNSVLVEVVWAKPYQPQASGTQSRWGSSHYIAILLFPTQRIISMDLGEGADIDSRVRSLLDALRNRQSDPRASAQALYEKLLAPIVPHLAGVSELYLSLDGTLHLVPFDALHDGQNYLLGRYSFHYLTSGRDLLREASTRKSAPALVIANPEFGQVEQALPNRKQLSLYQRLAGLSSLPGAQKEAEEISKMLGTQILAGRAATETALRGSASPAILHIATHGLFLNDLGIGSSGETGPAVRTKNISAPEAEFLPGGAGAMNRSALALAGVLQGHRAKSPAQDGLLTAQEARSLDLDGTQLVVLSACETGQGALSAGQGVYGLRRAFLVAGAETLVTSLWRVHDEATGELMALYYEKLLDKRKPGDRLGAMVEAMRELRARPGRSHPYYWAPFIVVGQTGSLRNLTSKTSSAP